MRHTRHALLIALILGSSICVAQDINDSNCMQHLGGGGVGDFICYQSHTKIIVSDNEKTANQINKTIPKRHAESGLLDKYMLTQDAAEAFCILPVDATKDWKPDTETATHIEIYDVIHAHCIYDLRKHQNDFLHGVLDAVKGSGG